MRRAVLAACISVGCVGCGRVAFDAARDAGETTDDVGDAADPDATSGACASYALCEDFETPTLAAYWEPMGGFARDTVVFNRGTASLRFTIPTLGPNIGARSIISQQVTFDETPNTIYVRAYVRFGGLPATNNRFPVFAVSEPVNGFENSVYVRPTSLSVYNQWSDSTTSNGMAPPVDTWLCMLWTIGRATTATGSVILGGDVAPAMLTNVITDAVPPLLNMTLGINFYAAGQQSSQPAIQLWLDDILVDDAPLTCAE